MGKQITNIKLSGILAGVGFATVICLCGLAFLTQMVLTDKAGEGSAAIAVPILMLGATWCGCMVTASVMKNNSIPGAAATTVVILLFVIISGLAMDGTYKNVLINVCAILSGGIVSCILCLKKRRKVTARKSLYR